MSGMLLKTADLWSITVLLRLYFFYFLDSHQGNQAENSAAHKWNPVIDHPQNPADRRQENCGDVIYGKTHRDAGGDITGVCDFLKIGLYGDVESVENLV